MRRRERRSVVVFIRGVALWIAILGLGYLELALALVDARHSLGYYVARFSTYPIDVMPIELPWPISEKQMLYGAAVLAGLAWLSAVLLWRLMQVGRVSSVGYLALLSGYAAWVLITEAFSAMGLIFALINGALAWYLCSREVTAVLHATRGAGT